MADHGQLVTVSPETGQDMPGLRQFLCQRRNDISTNVSKGRRFESHLPMIRRIWRTPPSLLVFPPSMSCGPLPSSMSLGMFGVRKRGVFAT